MSSSTTSSRKFLAFFAAALLLISGGFVLGSEMIVRTRVIPNHYFHKYLDLFRDTPSGNAVFGDSHAAYGLTGLDGFVNMAQGGEGFASIRGKVRLFYAERQPGKVILQAGLHHFSRAYLEWREDTTEEFGRLLRGERRFPLEMLQKVYRKELFNYWKVLLTGGTFDPQHPFLPDGSRPGHRNYADMPLSLRKVSAAREARTMEPVAAPEKTVIAAGYADIVDFLEGRGARVCLLTFPVASLLREELRGRQGIGRTRAFFAGLARDKGIRYVDMLEAELPDPLFGDSHHLNFRGAQRITGEVMRRCFP